MITNKAEIERLSHECEPNEMALAIAGVSIKQMAEHTGRQYRTLAIWANKHPFLFASIARDTARENESDKK